MTTPYPIETQKSRLGESPSATAVVVEELSSGPEITVLRSVAELEQLREVWKQWNRHPACDLDFYLTILAARDQILRPHVVAIFRGGIPDAILVGRLEHSSIDLKLGYFTLLQPKCRLLTFLYEGLLGNASDENCTLLARRVQDSLRADEADAAMFEHLRVDSPMYHAVIRRIAVLGPRRFIPAIHRAMEVKSDPGLFYAMLSARTRKNLKWQAKKMMSDHLLVSISNYRLVEQIEKMVRDVEAIAGSTYQRGLGVGFVNNSEMYKRMRLEAVEDRLRAYVLYVNAEPSAFWIGTLLRGTFHSGYMGYDIRLAKYSPGMFLITKVIEGFARQAENEIVERIDFGLGDAQYKEVLGTESWQESLVYMFAPSLRGCYLNLMHTSTAVLDRLAKAVLRRTKSLATVKRIVRNRARKA